MLEVLGCLAGPLGYVLNFLYNLVQNYGIAILLFTILLKIVMIPMSISQQRSMKKNRKMQDEMKKIKEKYSNNPEKLNQETIELYKRENMSPLSGCLTSILQIIILMSIFLIVASPLTYMKKIQGNEKLNALSNELRDEINAKNVKANYIEIAEIALVEEKYGEIQYNIDNYDKYVETFNKENTSEIAEAENKNENIEKNTEENSAINEENNQEDNKKEDKEEKKPLTLDELKERKTLLEELRINMSFLGLDLSMIPTRDITNIKALIIPILYVISTFISMKITTYTTSKKKKEQSKEIVVENPDEKALAKKEEDPQDMVDDMNRNMTLLMPIMSISIALIAPLGLALYWLTNNILMIIERLILNKVLKEEE